MTRFKAKRPEYWLKWQKTDKGRACQYRTLAKKYGVTVTHLNYLRKKQKHRCAICAAKEGAWKSNGGRLVVDHNHETKKVRGLLCPYCNRGLGQFWDKPKLLNAAAVYLETNAV